MILFCVSELSSNAMVLSRDEMLRLGKPCCTIAWRKVVVFCQIRPTRTSISMQTLPFLCLSRLGAVSQTNCPKMDLRLVVVGISNELVCESMFVVV